MDQRDKVCFIFQVQGCCMEKSTVMKLICYFLLNSAFQKVTIAFLHNVG